MIAFVDGWGTSGCMLWYTFIMYFAKRYIFLWNFIFYRIKIKKNKILSICKILCTRRFYALAYIFLHIGRYSSWKLLIRIFTDREITYSSFKKAWMMIKLNYFKVCVCKHKTMRGLFLFAEFCIFLWWYLFI